MPPTDDLSAGHGGGHPVLISRTVDIVLNVLFASPDNLHGPFDLLCDTHRDLNVVNFETASETAADEVVVYGYFFWRESGDLCSDRLRPGQDLRADPHFAAVRPDMHGAVEWLHGCVREKG